LHRLGVTRAELPEAKASRQEGDWLHAVLEAFFTGRSGDEQVLPPFHGEQLGNLGGSRDDARGQILERLHVLTEKLMPAGAQDSPLALHLKRHAWPAFADHVLKLHVGPGERRLRAQWQERQLRHPDGTPVTVAVGPHTIQLNGLIDSVDQWQDWHLITDYKRLSAPDKQAIKRGHSPQLLVYAMALEAMQPELLLSKATVGYWSILGGKWHEGLAGSDAEATARDAGLVSGRDRDRQGLEVAVANLRQHWQSRHDAVMQEGTFAPDASRCGYCEYSGICRRDDPELALLRTSGLGVSEAESELNAEQTAPRLPRDFSNAERET
jgi:RecB family exonuclease